MRDTQEIIEELNKLANDGVRQEYLINTDGCANAPTRIRYIAEKRPQDIPQILQTLKTPEARSYVMASALNILKEEHAPAVLKLLTAQDRLTYIRDEESGATEYGDITKPEFKCINYIIYCDLYLEHLQESKKLHPTYSLELTNQKIQVIKDARAILTENPESEDTLQKFYDHLQKKENNELLAKRRDTRLTSFLKSVGLEFLVNLAYNSFFVKTDGKKLIEKITAIDQQPTSKP